MRSVLEVERQRTRALADPRRRFGQHAEARRFLAEDLGPDAVTPGVWDGLLTALRQHTIQASLASLAAAQRQLLHMAFLEGRTNREIAAILSISRSTVRRRIVLALADLDDQIRRAGTWASTLLLLLFGWVVLRGRIVMRPVSALRAMPAGNVILTTAAGAAAGAVVFGAIATNQGAAAGDRGSTGSQQVTAGAPLLFTGPATLDSTTGGGPTRVPHRSSSRPADGTSSGSSALDPGCDGKPTNAPPATPVGPRTTHGSPVTHPQAGGCGPHGVERT